MWLIKLLRSQVIVAFLMFCCALKPACSTNMGELKSQQHALVQTTTSFAQQHPHHVSTQTQHQLHQQTPQSAGIAAHPVNGLNKNVNGVQHDSNTGHHNADAQDFPTSLASSGSGSSQASATATLTHLPSPQYIVHDKDMIMQELIKRFNTDTLINDQYQILNELKRGAPDNIQHTQPPPPPFVSLQSHNMAYPWSLYHRSYGPISVPLSQMAGLLTHNVNPFETYSAPYPVMPRVLPIMSYPQPVYVPYPFIIPPDMFYSSYSNLPEMSNDYEDSMSRGAASSRRTVSSQHSSSFPRNSPIFYVRLPPTPYMFLPSLGLGSSTSTMTSFPNFIPYQSLPPFPSYSSIYNVPINFVTNGKPTNIYQIGAPPNDIPNSLQFSNIPANFNTRDPTPPITNAYRPAPSAHNYFNLPPSSSSSSSSSASSSLYASYPGTSTGSELTSSTPTHLGTSASLSYPDSKLTALKRPYFFNGRPDDIYILPNNFNSLYSAESSYY